MDKERKASCPFCNAQILYASCTGLENQMLGHSPACTKQFFGAGA